ncbi:hypothetical protein C2E23DRAFT_881115 [Lenzites betulinus]|nr:hypothetical protein C2E23DRAFT_881115 [Lenzites betulinus]
MILTQNANDGFPAGTPVLIEGHVLIPDSPTPAYGQQDTTTMSSGNTMYRFGTWRVYMETISVDTPDGRDSVAASQLSPQRPPQGMRVPTSFPTASQKRIEVGEDAYLLEEVNTEPIPLLGNTVLKLRKGTCVKIKTATSRNGPAGLSKTGIPYRPSRYIVTANVEVEKKDFVRCRAPRTHECFRRPTTDEMALILKRKLDKEPRAPRVVS